MTDECNHEQPIEETKTGVSVTVKSKRGDGTRDQDTVTVKAQYEDLREAGKSVERLNTMLNHQLSEARRNDPATTATTDRAHSLLLSAVIERESSGNYSERAQSIAAGAVSTLERHL